MEKLKRNSWTEKITSAKVLKRVEETRAMVEMKVCRMKDWIGYIVRS